MADIDVVQKPAGQNTWLWAMLAIVSVVGLMGWLAVQSNRTTTGTVVQENVDQERQPAGQVPTVELAALGSSPDDYIGQQVTVDAPVAATLGPRAFWAEIPGANPFLVVLTGDASTTPLAAGSDIRVSGLVIEVSEQAVDGWIADGAVNSGSRAEASFASHAILADQVHQ